MDTPKVVETFSQFATTFEGLSVSVAFLSALGTVAALVFISRQVHHASRQVDEARKQAEQVRIQVEVSAMGQLVQLMTEINKVFIAEHDLRDCFFEKRSLADSDASYNKAQAIAEMFLDVFDHVLTHVSELPEFWSRHGTFWQDWIVDMFRRSPTLCAYYRKKGDGWYTDDLAELYRRATALQPTE